MKKHKHIFIIYYALIILNVLNAVLYFGDLNMLGGSALSILRSSVYSFIVNVFSIISLVCMLRRKKYGRLMFAFTPLLYLSHFIPRWIANISIIPVYSFIALSMLSVLNYMPYANRFYNSSDIESETCDMVGKRHRYVHIIYVVLLLFVFVKAVDKEFPLSWQGSIFAPLYSCEKLKYILNKAKNNTTLFYATYEITTRENECATQELIQHLDASYNPVSLLAALELGKRGNVEAVPYLILHLSGWSKRKEEAVEYLNNLTGQDYGLNYEEWKQWWNVNNPDRMIQGSLSVVRGQVLKRTVTDRVLTWPDRTNDSVSP